MRFATISTARGPAAATLAPDGSVRGRCFVDDGSVQSLDVAIQSQGDLGSYHALLCDGDVFEAGSFSFLPPLREPRKILCVGLNYRDHTKESPYEQPDYPTIFGRFASSLIGHEEAIVRPRVSTALDYEGELVAIIGKGGRHIPLADALDHVMGYALFNDASIRDYQFKTPQWTIGKNFDATGAFGPWVVTADEIPAAAAGLAIETRLNGVVVQSSNTSDMVFGVAQLVSVLSEALTLLPGDLLVTGTPAGVGMARKPPLYMKAGDVCEVEVEKVGILRNPIVDEG